MEKEIWKNVKDFEFFYEVSNFGRVRRNWHGKWKYLKSKQDDGYHRVNLSKNGAQKMRKVHHLVMEAFMGIDFETLPKNLEAHHVDENTNNNQPNNLIVITKLDHRKLSAKQRLEKWKKKTAQRIRYEKIMEKH